MGPLGLWEHATCFQIYLVQKQIWIRKKICTLDVTYTARGSVKTSVWMCIIRSPPAVYSITKHTCSEVWKHANKLTRKGWWDMFTISKMRFSHIRLQGGKRGKKRWRGGKEEGDEQQRKDEDTDYCWAINTDTDLSTSSRAMISPFFRALMAYIVPVFLYSDSNTCRQKSNNSVTL